MGPVRVMLWGCGRIARMFHLRHLAAHPEVSVVAVADAAEENRAAAAEVAPGAKVSGDYRETLALEADAVVICLPPALHAPSAVAAFEAGYAVYLEKPLALDGESGRRAVEAWQASGSVGVMGYNFRFHPRFADLRDRLGEIGPLRAVQSRFTSPGRTLPAWKRTRAGGGGVLLDLGSHHADLVRHLLGLEPRRVWAVEQSREVEADNALLSVELDGGVLMQSTLSMNSVQAHRWDVFGAEGRLGVDLGRPLRLEVQDNSWAGARVRRIRERLQGLSPREILLRPGWEPSFGRSLDAFVAAVRSGIPDPRAASLADGLASLRVILAAEEAARTGRAQEVA
jgi:predicted dehydrogenase